MSTPNIETMRTWFHTWSRALAAEAERQAAMPPAARWTPPPLLASAPLLAAAEVGTPAERSADLAQFFATIAQHPDPQYVAEAYRVLRSIHDEEREMGYVAP